MARRKGGQKGRKGKKEGRARRNKWQEGRKDKKESMALMKK